MRFRKKNETENRHEITEITDSFDQLNYFDKNKQHVFNYLQMLKLVYKFSAKKTSISHYVRFLQTNDRVLLTFLNL